METDKRVAAIAAVVISIIIVLVIVFAVALQEYPRIHIVDQSISCQNGVVSFEFRLVNEGRVNGYATIEFRYLSNLTVTLDSARYLVLSGESVSVNHTITDSLGCRQDGLYSADITLQARA